MERSSKSLEKMPSSGTSVQIQDGERTLTTLTLDVLQRLTILESSIKFADIQRNGIENKLEHLASICVAKKDVEELIVLVKQHEDFFKEFRFGLRVAKIGWAVMYLTGGSLFGALVQWWVINH